MNRKKFYNEFNPTFLMLMIIGMYRLALLGIILSGLIKRTHLLEASKMFLLTSIFFIRGG